jgi:TetR/AcrR family transcriptional regulator, regulator of biofilm formation and stress response
MSKLQSGDGTRRGAARQAGPARATREDGRQTRAAIVAATLRVLRDEGIGSLTHRAVAREADVSLALTTYHFATKENLIAEALNVAAAETLDGLREAATGEGDGALAPAAVADRLSDMTMERLGDERLAVFAVVELSLAAARRPSLHGAVAAWNAEYHRVVAGLLERAGIGSPRQASRLVVATLEGLVFLQLTEADPRFEQDVLRPSMRALVAALARSSPDRR